MIKIGLITIGQSPRQDIIKDITPILGDDFEIVEVGALDNFVPGDFARFLPEPCDYVLISRLRDGTRICIAEKYILPIIQDLIDNLEAQGVALIVLLCTGKFPSFTAGVPLLYPSDILEALVPVICGLQKIAIVIPDRSQISQAQDHWSKFVNNPKLVAASPYGNTDDLDIAINEIKDKGEEVKFVIMDCIGYSIEMKKKVIEKTGRFVLLPRTLIANILKEFDGLNYYPVSGQ